MSVIVEVWGEVAPRTGRQTVRRYRHQLFVRHYQAHGPVEQAVLGQPPKRMLCRRA
jgi:hypothetical protein